MGIPFDESKTGKRIESEIPEQKERDSHDPEYRSFLDERTKMQKEGALAEKHDQEPRMESIQDQIKVFLEKNNITKSVGYFINRKVVDKILKIHPFIRTKNQLARLSDLPSARVPQLSLKTKKWARVEKKHIKNMAKVLEVKNWKVLVDHKMMKDYDSNQMKAKNYLEEVKKIEQEVIEDSPEDFSQKNYSIMNIKGN